MQIKMIVSLVLLSLALTEGSLLLAQGEPARPPQSLQEKMQRFHRHGEKWQRVGRIMKAFHQAMEQREFAKAESTLDRALRIIEAGPGDQSNKEELDQFRRKTDEAQYLVLPIKEAGHLYGGRVAELEKPANKMYSHVAAGAGVIGSPGVKYTNAPISIAVADSCRPGWTTYPVGPLRDNFRVLYEVLAANGNPPWASTEASPQLGSGGTSMGEYLQRHFDFGATVVVFNTGATNRELAGRLHDAVWDEEAIQAYRDFLALRLEKTSKLPLRSPNQIRQR